MSPDRPTQVNGLFDAAQTTFSEVRQGTFTANAMVFDGKPEINFTWNQGPLLNRISLWVSGRTVNFSVSAHERSEGGRIDHTGATTVMPIGKTQEQLREQLQGAYDRIASWDGSQKVA